MRQPRFNCAASASSAPFFARWLRMIGRWSRTLFAILILLLGSLGGTCLGGLKRPLTAVLTTALLGRAAALARTEPEPSGRSIDDTTLLIFCVPHTHRHTHTHNPAHTLLHSTHTHTHSHTHTHTHKEPASIGIKLNTANTNVIPLQGESESLHKEIGWQR
jgi:hypothetical protein